MESRGSGWLIGDFDWEFNNHGPYGGEDFTRSCPTAFMDSDEPILHSNYNLVRVVPDLDHGGHLLADGRARFDIELAATRIRGLASR